jgi:hypothetical protein
MGMTLSPMVGLGSNGAGVGGTMMPGGTGGALGGLPPQLLLAALARMQGGGAMPPGGPTLGAGAAPGPMAGVQMRNPQMGGAMPPPGVMPQGAPPQPQGGAGIGPQLMQLAAGLNGQGAPGGQGGPAGLLAMLKGGQSGVAPAPLPASTPGLVFNPMNPVGTSALGGATANQGSLLANLFPHIAGLFGG